MHLALLVLLYVSHRAVPSRGYGTGMVRYRYGTLESAVDLLVSITIGRMPVLVLYRYSTVVTRNDLHWIPTFKGSFVCYVRRY